MRANSSCCFGRAITQWPGGRTCQENGILGMMAHVAFRILSEQLYDAGNGVTDSCFQLGNHLTGADYLNSALTQSFYQGGIGIQVLVTAYQIRNLPG